MAIFFNFFLKTRSFCFGIMVNQDSILGKNTLVCNLTIKYSFLVYFRLFKEFQNRYTGSLSTLIKGYKDQQKVK